MPAFTQDEFRALLQAAKAKRERDWLMILVSYWHALRASEVTQLTRDSFMDGFVDVQRLKGSKRTIQKLVSDADPLFDEAGALLDYLPNFMGKQRIFPICRSWYWRLVKRYGAVANIAWHKCRTTSMKHTILSELVEAKGVPIAQAHGGHVSGNSTLKYTAKTSEQSDAAVAVLHERRPEFD